MSMTQTVLLMAAAIGYVLLLFRQIRTGSYGLTPLFTCYVAGLVLYYCIWNAHSEWKHFLFQPILLFLRVVVALEALWLVIDALGVKERRWLVLMLGLYATAGALIASLFNFDGVASSMQVYRAIHQTVNVAIGVGAVVAIGYLAIDIPDMKPWARNHGLIFTLLSISHIVTGYMSDWQAANVTFFLSTCLCIGLWLACGLPFSKTQNMRDLNLKIPYPVR